MKKEPVDARSGFYVKTSEDSKSFEIVENFELTNEYKQHVCLPYFKEVYKVHSITSRRILVSNQIGQIKESAKSPS